jgi:hypothetical protein
MATQMSAKNRSDNQGASVAVDVGGTFTDITLVDALPVRFGPRKRPRHRLIRRLASSPGFARCSSAPAWSATT